MLGEVLTRCDVRSLLAALLESEMGWHLESDALDSRSGQALVAKVASTLDVMRLLYARSQKPSPSRNASCAPCAPQGSSWGSSVIVPRMWFEALDGHGVLRLRIGAALADLSDASDVRRASGLPEHGCTVGHVRDFKRRHGMGSVRAAWRWDSVCRSLERLSWE